MGQLVPLVLVGLAALWAAAAVVPWAAALAVSAAESVAAWVEALEMELVEQSVLFLAKPW